MTTRTQTTGSGLGDLLFGGTGTLRLYSVEPQTLDPALVQYTDSAEYVVEIFSGLVALDSRLQVVPDLAERWEISEDGLQYTFYLREGARFHNGRQVVASDVKYSLERACDPRTGSAVASVYLDDIVGASEMLSGQASELRGVEVVDERTVRIKIDAPKAHFLPKLTYSTAFVVDRDSVDRGDWLRHPNGTGPFRLTAFSAEQIVLERNDLYYREQAKLQKVVFWLAGGSPMSMYENGELDVVQVWTGDVERVLDPSNPLHADLIVVPQLDISYLGFDVRQPPFEDRQVREAISLAIDREKLAEVVLNGLGLAAEGIVPPGVPDYSRQRPLLPFDPVRARALLQSSSYGGNEHLPAIVLRIAGEDGELPRDIEAVVAMLRDNLGIEVQVEQSEDVFGGQPSLFASGWSADYPDPHNFLDLLFHSDSALNRSGYANARVDALLEAARLETQTGQRMDLYRQAEELIIADMPWVPLWHSVDYVLRKPYIKGTVHAATIVPWLAGVYVER